MHWRVERESLRKENRELESRNRELESEKKENEKNLLGQKKITTKDAARNSRRRRIHGRLCRGRCSRFLA